MTAASTPDATLARIALRPIGHPLPLGFLGLAAATTAVAALQLAWFPKTEGANVALILIAFVFPTQLVSSVFGYLARDSVAGTGMAILAGTWLTVGLVMRTSPAGATSKALAVFLVVAGVAMLVPALGALGSKLLPAAVLTTTALRFFVTAGYQWTAANGWKTAAGVVGLFLGALAVYAALAIELEEARGHSVLPAGRRGKGAAATRGLLADQLEGLEHAPGVRRQL
jgi:succinate-acetate transporter protein